MDVTIIHKPLHDAEFAALEKVISAETRPDGIYRVLYGMFALLLLGTFFHVGVQFVAGAVVMGGVYFFIFHNWYWTPCGKRIEDCRKILSGCPAIVEEHSIRCTDEGIGGEFTAGAYFIKYAGIPWGYLADVPGEAGQLLYLPCGLVLRSSEFPDAESFAELLSRIPNMRREKH